MKTNFVYLRSVFFLFLLTFNLTSFAADFYWTGAAGDGLFTNTLNWGDGLGGSAPANSSTGQPIPDYSDNVYFLNVTGTPTTINCTNGYCQNINVTNSASSGFNFTGTLNVYGSINSPVNQLVLLAGSKIIFSGNGVKTILLSNSSASTIDFEFYGNGSYSLSGNLDSFGNSGLFNIHENTQISSNGYDLNLNTIKFTAPAGSASMILNNSNVNLHEGIFYGEWNGTLPPGPGVSVAALNTNLELSVIYNNSGAQSLIGLNNLKFRPGTAYPVRSSGNMTIQSNTVYVDANSYGAYADLTCDYFELLKPTAISGIVGGAIRFNDFVLPMQCTGTSSLNFVNTVNSYTLENLSGIPKTIELLFKNVTVNGSLVNSNSTNNQGGNIGNINFTAPPLGKTFLWIGGAGDWNDPTNWLVDGFSQGLGGCIPTLLDDVFFDVNSFAPGENVTNVNSTPLFSKNVNWTDPDMDGGIQGGVSQFYNWYIAGTADFSGMNPTVGAKAYLYLIGSNTHDLNLGTMTYPRSIYFDGSGTYNLQTPISILSNSNFSINHRNGILNTNGFPLTATSISSYPLAMGMSRQLYMDNSTVSTDNFQIASGLMSGFSASNSIINLNSSGSILSIYEGYSAFTAPVTLTSMVLPEVNFMSSSGTPQIQYGSNVISITELNVTPNLKQVFGAINVGTLNLTGGTTISLNNLKITNAVNVNGALCGDIVTIKSNSSGAQGFLYKPAVNGPFTIDRAYVKDISASAGGLLTVTNGVDGGNNSNVSIGTGTPRNFYWVGDSGDWNDPEHWSIAASGASYPTNSSTNPDGCLPTAIDNVYFDPASFNLSGSTVSITSDANCKDMIWTGVTNNPTLDGTNIPSLNVFGSLILQNGMSWTYPGTVNILGTENTVNSQVIDFDGVTMSGQLWFQGGGRYDILSNLNILGLGAGVYNTGSFFVQAGKVYTNGFNISTASIRSFLDIPTNFLDASNSTITCQYVWNSHAATVNYDFNNSTFINSTGATGILIETPTTVNYHNFILGGTSLNTNGTVIAQNVTRTAPVTTTTGNWVMDTLILAKSSENTFQAGRTITVNDTLVAFGTPCIPVILKANGGTATYESTSLNTLINFGSLENMTASLAPAGSTPTDYQVIGANVGGNTNWTFAPAASLSYLGTYNVSANCDALPYAVSTAGFSPVSGSTYAWSNGSTASSISIDTAGIYSVAVTYAPNCTVVDSIAFTIANTLDIQSTSIVMPGCFEDSTGTISMSILGGNNNFDYTWTSPTGNTFTINTADSTQLSDLAAGDYQIIVNQTNNPVCADTLTISITEPTLLTPDLTVSNLACNGDTDGSISATGNGGTPGYQVSMNGGSFNPAPFNFTGLNAGSYEIVVQDLNGCLDTINQSIIQPTVLTASGSNTSALCNGDANGSVDLTINGGTPAYNVSVNGGAFAPSNPTYGGLSAGSYEFIVEDQNGCRDTISQIVTEPSVLLTSTTVTSSYNGADVSCNGLTDATISSTTSGGTINYSYSWNTIPVQTTQNISGVGAGSYTVSVTDQNGCTTQSTVNVTEPAVLSDTYVVNQNANCNVADGEATITTLGGTPGYTYNWSNNAGNNSNSATDLPAGITNVTITDANGCTDNISITVNSINAPFPYISTDSVLCLGGNTGVAFVDSVVGNGGYTFIWMDNLGNPIGQTTGSATNLTAGTYSVQVTDQNGCTSTETVVIEEPTTSVSIAVLNVSIPACNASDEGSISVSASGGTGVIGYSWNTNPIQTTPSITNLPEGSYTVTATDENGCSINETIQITAPTPVTLTYTQNDVSCFGLTDGDIFVTAQGGTPNYSYSWTGNISSSNQATNLMAGTYDVIVSDVNGCSDSLSFIVSQPSLLEATVVSTIDGDCGVSNGQINIEVTGGTPIYSFVWSDGNVNQNTTTAQSGLNTVVVTDQNGCEQMVEVDMSCILFEIPELLTPNADGSNDKWEITGLENYPNTEVLIYNRWGTKVFESDDYQNDWEGKSESNLNIGGDELPESSYYYILTLGGNESDPNSGKLFKGYIYIKRN